MTDEICIRQVLSGNSEAYRHLISKYKDMAYSIAMSVIKDEFYAEEIMQISFIKAFDKLNSYNGTAKFSTWLYRIVVNESFKQVKKHKTELIYYMDTVPDISSDIDSVILKLEEDNQRYYINEALKRLSSKESLVLRLFYLEQNSIEEISDITSWSKSDLKVTLHRARINLEHILTQIFKLDKKVLY